MRFADIFLIAIFLLEAAKWGFTALFGRQIAQIIYLAGLLLPILLYLLRSKVTISSIKDSLAGCINVKTISARCLLVIYLLLVIVSLFRSVPTYPVLEILGRIATVGTLSLTAWVLSRSYSMEEIFSRVWKLFTIGLGMYVWLNILGWSIGLTNEYTQSTQIAALRTGLIFREPVFFPFNPNHQSFSYESGLLLILSVIGLRYPDSNKTSRFPMLGLFSFRIVYWFFILGGLFGLLAVRVRIPYAAVVFTLLFAVLWSTLRKRASMVLVSIMIVVPLFFSSGMPLKIVHAMHDDLGFLGNLQSLEELATLNNRHLIWEPVLNEFGTFKMTHLIGFGAFGQYSSGLTSQIAQLWETPERITIHNTLLQQLVDLGYLGALLFVGLFVHSINWFSNTYTLHAGRKRYVYNKGMATLVYLTFASTGEVAIYYPLISTLAFSFLMISFLTTRGDFSSPAPEIYLHEV